MKKLISLMIGMGLVLGSTALMFGQEKQDTSTKKTKKKKKSETTKKGSNTSL
ncbi:MAG TPA: hypothetical protein VME43_01565 [Bryobacteraceae bacterium]|nr:hypothetical protein [Bryobacteraceae bacterium]